MKQKLSEGSKAGYDSRVGSSLGRGPNVRKKDIAAPWSSTWPATQATLDLDFANDRGFVRGVGQGRSMDAVTFTRASSGNWVDSTGTLRTGAGSFTGSANALGNNLLTFPQDFDNAAWSGNNYAVVAKSFIAPDSTNTAYLFREDSSNTTHRFYRASAISNSGGSYTGSIYVYPAGRNWVYIQQTYFGGATQRTWFNLSDGTIGTTGTNQTPAITLLSNGWYRIACTISSVFTSDSSFLLGLANADNNTTYQGNGTSGIYIWGAQLEVGSTATTYYPTNINTPRFDWASTAQITPTASNYTATTTAAVIPNLLTYSQDFSNAIWNKTSVSITNNATTDPVGGNTATQVTSTSVAVGSRLYQRFTGDGFIRTFSFYIKKGSGASDMNSILVRNETDATNLIYSFINLDTGVITNTTGLAYSQDVGNGWWRVYGTFTATNAKNIDCYCGAPYAAVGVGLYSYIWGAQLELANTNTPLAANPTCNGLLIEESRANRLLWCRDGLNGGTAVGTNLLQRSEEFDNAYWTKSRGTVSANTTNTTDPLGGNTADSFVESAGQTYSPSIDRTVTSVTGITYTISIYAKPNGTNYLRIAEIISSSSVRSTWFNLSNGTVGTKNAAHTASITDVGNGWYRCSVTVTVTTGRSERIVFLPEANDNTDTTVGVGNGLYLWGAQLTPLSFITDYQATTSAEVSQAWSKSNVTVAKDQTGIDGVANSATSITASAANGVLIQPISLASGSRTGSVYLKRITGTGNVQVTLDGSTWSTVDLSNGLWNRIVLSGTVTNPTVGVRLATNGDAVAMDYGQIEDGAFATSPILTTTASVTRAVDLAQIRDQNFIGWYRQDQGTVFVTAKPPSNVALLGNAFTFILSAGFQLARENGSGAAGTRWYIKQPGNITSSFLSAPSDSGDFVNFAFSYRNANYDLAKNGNLLTPLEQFSSLPTSTGLVLGNNGNVNASINGYIKRFTFYPTKVTANGLAEMSK